MLGRILVLTQRVSREWGPRFKARVVWLEYALIRSPEALPPWLLEVSQNCQQFMKSFM
jgi:hypothetical protein